MMKETLEKCIPLKQFLLQILQGWGVNQANVTGLHVVSLLLQILQGWGLNQANVTWPTCCIIVSVVNDYNLVYLWLMLSK